METVQLPKSVRSGIATEGSRYAIHGLLLQPGANNTVHAVSTDGHQLTVVELEGSLSEPFIVPADALPTTKGGVTAQFTGQNGTRTVSTVRPNGKRDVTDLEEVPGSFPPIKDVIPEAVPGATVLCIDADVLLKAARALVTDPDKPPVVTLLIDSSRDKQNRAIPIVTPEGFGVVMPCNSDSANRDHYNGKREAFLAG